MGLGIGAKAKLKRRVGLSARTGGQGSATNLFASLRSSFKIPKLKSGATLATGPRLKGGNKENRGLGRVL